MKPENILVLSVLVITICIVIASTVWILLSASTRNVLNEHKFFQKKDSHQKPHKAPKYQVNVINMDKDASRMRLFEQNWKHLFQIQRFPAVKMNIRMPHIGCVNSHIECVRQYFKENPKRNIVIVMEDDAVPFLELNTHYLHEYLDKLESHASEFEIANMSPIVWDSTYSAHKKVTTCPFAPDHFVVVYNGNDICAGHFLVYSRNILPTLDQIHEYVKEDTQIPIVIDRIWQLSHGGFKIPNLRLVIPNVQFAYQNDGYSNNSGSYISLTTPAILKRMHKLMDKFWDARKDPVDTNVIEYLRRHQSLKQVSSGVTAVAMFFPISSKMSANHYIQYGKHLLQNIPVHIVLVTTPELKDTLVSYRPANWPLTVLTFPSYKNLYPFHSIPDSAFDECSALVKRVIKKNITQDLLRIYLTKHFAVKKAIEACASQNRETKYYYYIDFGSFRKERRKNVPSSGNKIFKNPDILKFFPSYSKLDMIFHSQHEKQGKPMHFLYQRKTRYNKSLESTKHMDKWDIAAGHFATTKAGIDWYCDMIQKELPYMLSQNKYPFLLVDECLIDLFWRKYRQEIKTLFTGKTLCDWFGFYQLLNDIQNYTVEDLLVE